MSRTYYYLYFLHILLCIPSKIHPVLNFVLPQAWHLLLEFKAGLKINSWQQNLDKQARVHNKLRFMNSPKGSLMEDVLNIILIFTCYFF